MLHAVPRNLREEQLRTLPRAERVHRAVIERNVRPVRRLSARLPLACFGKRSPDWSDDATGYLHVAEAPAVARGRVGGECVGEDLLVESEGRVVVHEHVETAPRLPDERVPAAPNDTTR